MLQWRKADFDAKNPKSSQMKKRHFARKEATRMDDQNIRLNIAGHAHYEYSEVARSYVPMHWL